MSSSLAQNRDTVVLEIGGQRIRLPASNDRVQLERLAREVNDRFAVMQRQTRATVPAAVLALVALQLADELDEARRSLSTAKDQSTQALSAAETRAREIEQMARRAVTEAIAEIDRALAIDDEAAARTPSAESESA
jgi:cell division protein ZapA (FtsZ GTPase activity inhibitor)